MADSKVLSADELGKIIDFQWLWANRILRLDDYDSISIEALELLELWEGDLAFDGLQQIQSPAIAECLVACTADHLLACVPQVVRLHHRPLNAPRRRHLAANARQ